MQKTGYLYKRAPQSTAWQQRYVTLNTDSGTMKFFAEKSGNRVQKGSVCIKHGKFTLLNQAEIGHMFAFEIVLEDMVGKSDEAVQTLSVDTQAQLDQWKEWIELAFQPEKRKNSMNMGDLSRTSSMTATPTGSEGTPARSRSFLASLFPSVDTDRADLAPVDPSTVVTQQPAEPHSGSSSAYTGPVFMPVSAAPVPVTAAADSSTGGSSSAPAGGSDSLQPLPTFTRPIKPITRKPSKMFSAKDFATAEKDDGPDVDMASIYRQESAVLFTDPNVPDTPDPRTAAVGDVAPQPAAASAEPVEEDKVEEDVNPLAEKLEMKLNARRQSYKAPNFKNLLNSNGIDQQARRSIVTSASDANSETDSTAPSSLSPNPQGVSADAGSAGASNNAHQDGAAPHGGHGHGHHHHHHRSHSHGHGHHHRTDSNTSAQSAHSAQSATSNPSPLTEPLRIETPTSELSPAMMQTAEGLAPRRSFTKSPARRRTSKKAGGQDSDSSRPHTPSPLPGPNGAQPNAHALTRHLKISVRPTEPVRTGNLYKLDSAHAQDAANMGQDVWLAQYISMDITTGMMFVYTEINGKRIQRLKFDINSCTVKSIDQIYHSRLHCFKITYRPEDPNEKKVVAVFAAEDEDTLNYWLVSFEDCEVYFHAHGAHTLENGQAASASDGIAAGDHASRHAVTAAASAVAASDAPPSVVSAAAPRPPVVPGKVDPSALMEALRKRNAPKIDVDEEEEPPHSASMHPFSAGNRFASAPAVAHAQVSTRSQLSENTPFGSSEMLTGGDTLQRIDTMNMDQMFTAQNSPHVRLAPVHASHATAGAVLMSPPSEYDFSKLALHLKRVRYPSERLARRIKIWYSSSGFALSTAAEVEQFVKELKNTGDKVLADFSEEKFGELKDWANLLAVLRKYEQRKLLDTPRGQVVKPPGIAFELTAKKRGDPATQDFDLYVEGSTAAADITRQLASHIGAAPQEVERNLPRLLLSQDTNVLGKGLGLLSDDLTFAEDLLLYQEEVIDDMWSSFTRQKGLLEERDETITSLYERLDAAEKAAKRGPITSISHPVLDNHSWLEEKNQLVQAHNDAKVKLITEIQTLRKMLTPTAEQHFNELRGSEFLRVALEEEVINTHIQNDNLKAELAALKDKFQEAENEKAAVESHWQDQINKLKAEHERTVAKLQGEIKKAQQVAQRSADEAANARRLSVKPPPAPSLPSPAGDPTPGASSVSSLTPAQTPGSASAPAATPVAQVAASSTGPAPAQTLTIVSRYASPKHPNDRVNKAYVNHYANFEEPTTSKPPAARSDAANYYNPYNYSAEIKDEYTPAPKPSTEPPNMWPAGHAAPTPVGSGGSLSGHGSVNSLRRDQLVDPEDEHERHFEPLAESANKAPSGWANARNTTLASIRMMRLPNAGGASPMPHQSSNPATPYGVSAPSPTPAANPLQVPRSQMKSNSIRAALRNEAQSKPASAGAKSGAYMAPHATNYAVLAADEAPKSRGAPPPSVSPGPQYLSATKATSRQAEVTRETARDRFARTYTYQKG